MIYFMVEYGGVNVPVQKLDRHDKWLARHAATIRHSGSDEMGVDVFSDPMGYQAYKQHMVELKSKTPLARRALVFAKDLLNRGRRSPRRRPRPPNSHRTLS